MPRAKRRRGSQGTRKPKTLQELERELDDKDTTDADLEEIGVGRAPEPDEVVARYLTYFDFEGGSSELRSSVPDELLEQLADMFIAKRGKAARHLLREQVAEKVAIIVQRKLNAARRLKRMKPIRGRTPFVMAIEGAAKQLGKSPEYVRKLYRLALRLARS